MKKKEALSADRIQQVQSVARSFKEKQQLLNTQRKELKELHEQIQMSHNAKIKVKGSIYPGVTVNISEVSMNIKSERTFSKFLKLKASFFFILSLKFTRMGRNCSNSLLI